MINHCSGALSGSLESTFTSGFQSVNGSLPDHLTIADGIIPTLTDLESDTWASQLTTLFATSDVGASVVTNGIVLDNLPADLRFDNIELVMFNCPQWLIGPDFIAISSEDTLENLNIEFAGFPTSCDRLVHVCLSMQTVRTNVRALELTFMSNSSSFRWIHLAEVILNDRANCPGNLLAPTLEGLGEHQHLM